MERTTKRVFCLLLALAMVLSVGVSAFAYGSTVTVYCQAPEEWETCYVYWWGSTESVVWPGAVMTQRSDGLWYYDVPTDATNLIFNNSYEYSLDLDMPTGDKVKYVYDSDSWEIPYGGNTGSVTPGGSIGGSTGSVTPGGSIGGSTDTPDTVTVYCQAPEEWETCYVYWWGSTESVVWPGKVMTQRSDGLWYYAVPADASNLVFHNLSEFSPDLDMPTGDKVKYVYDSDSWESPYGESAVAETDPVKIMEAAVLLRENEELPYDVFLSGKVTVVDDAYNAEYENISVTIAVNGTRSFLKCYRLKGDGVDKVAVGDTITVTGRIKNYNGTLEFVNCTMTKRVSGGGTAIKQETDPVKILEAANKLKENEEMAYDVTLSGKVTVVDDAYNAEYKNISVTIAVSGTSSILKVYNMKGNGIDKIAVGDAITVTGRIKNYYGTIELVRGTMTSLTSGGGTAVKVETDPLKIVDAAYNLAKDTQLAYDATLTGTVTLVNNPYDVNYKNVSVTIVVAGRESKPILCYRLKGNGVDRICAGDKITVKGRLKNYNGTVEFDAGCQLINSIYGDGVVVVQPATAQIMEDAFALKEGEVLPYEATPTGMIISVDTPYSSQYENITVTMVIPGYSGRAIRCYRMRGTGVDEIIVGDTITVTGSIVNDNGIVEFATINSQDMTCILVEYQKTGARAPSDPKQIVEAAYALEKNTSLPYKATLTGTITSVDTEYSPTYKNITVTIAVAGCEDRPIICYRLKGEGVETVKVGDSITVSGTLKRYFKEATDETLERDEVMFTPGCTLDKMNDGSLATPDETTPDVPEDAPGGNIGGSTDTPGTDTPGTALPKDNNDSVLTLWAKVPSAWTTVNAYTWDAANTAQNGEWPGTTMTKDGEWYKIVITNKVVNVIINNGADQTPDLKVDSGKDLYVVVGDDKKATVYYADGTTAGDTTPCTHSYETTVISPTCTQPGYALHTCSLCGISYTGGEIPAKGHRFPDFVSDGNATCTKDGTETAVCLGCGKPSTRVETGSALGHSFTTYLYDYNAQCGKDGTETAKCDRCSLTDTRTAAGTALEHTFENGACTSCGAAETAGLVGDVTGDGKINIMDVVKLYAHVKGTPITDEYALACGDVSDDGKINIMDVVKLYAHVKGVSLVTKPSEEETVPTDKIKLEYAFLLPGKTERYELSIRIGDEVFLKSMTIQPGVSSVTIPLIGSGTVVYDLYVDGEYLRSETVIFASDK